MGYMADGYLFIVGRAKDMIIINGKNHWPQDIEWAVEQLPGFNHGDIAAFSVETENGEEAPAVLVHCRVSDPDERVRLRDTIRDKVRSITGMNCVVELVPPRTLPRASSGKLSRANAQRLYLAGEIEPFELAAEAARRTGGLNPGLQGSLSPPSSFSRTPWSSPRKRGPSRLDPLRRHPRESGDLLGSNGGLPTKRTPCFRIR